MCLKPSEVQCTGRASERPANYGRIAGDALKDGFSSMIFFFPPSSEVYLLIFCISILQLLCGRNLLVVSMPFSFMFVLVLYVAIALVFGVSQTRCGSTGMAWSLDNAASTIGFPKPPVLLTAALTHSSP